MMEATNPYKTSMHFHQTTQCPTWKTEIFLFLKSGEEQKSQSSPLCSFLQSLGISPVSEPNVSPPASCSQTLSTYGVEYFTNLCSQFKFTFIYYFNKTEMYNMHFLVPKESFG
jgi:hypothetical protein